MSLNLESQTDIYYRHEHKPVLLHQGITLSQAGLPQRTSFAASKTRIPLNLGLVCLGLLVNAGKITKIYKLKLNDKASEA